MGLPAAVAFGKKAVCWSFDINPQRILELKQGIDRTETTSAGFSCGRCFYTPAILMI